ncbi:MAG TPA: aminoacetone oxidase family FAD-binding enzyme [Bacilli bacterium]|nr:aminoacetone oxidase family FAD-binding enzyme [Bacilli bacterium]
MKDSRKIVVIGGGASGMVAAIKAKETNPNAEVIIIDRMKQLGKKLLATGNGKGNFSNIKTSPHYYNDPTFVEEVFRQVSLFDTIHFFNKLGVFPKNDAEGRMYPFSDQASAIHDVLVNELQRLGIILYLESNVTSILKQESTFEIVLEDKRLLCDLVIICAGGKAYPNLGSNGSGYQLLQSLGHHVTPIYPSLVGLKVKEDTKQLGGIRVKGNVTLRTGNMIIGTEDGEIQLRDTGISGIVVMQMSVIIARRKVLGLNEMYQIEIDLMPTVSLADVNQMLNERKESIKDKAIGDFYLGMFHQNLGKDMLKRLGIIRFSDKTESITKSELTKLANLIKHYNFHFVDFYQFDDAQVCSGGIQNDEFDSHTLESKLVRGLYVAGELLNVDGETGGFNLQWAWSSGMLAGKSAASTKL